MIGALTGTIHFPITNPLLLMVSGVGYRVAVPESVCRKVHEGDPVFLYIHTHVREDALDLYGFTTAEDLMMFTHLISVSGIGPKTSLGVIDRGTTAVRQAVTESDVAFFTSIPRLGRKNAQKIIIELKTKLGSLKDLELAVGEHGDTKDILEALESMGFAKKEIYEALKHVSSDSLSVEERLKQTLKVLSKTGTS